MTIEKIKTKLRQLLDRTLLYNKGDFNHLKDRAHRTFDDELHEIVWQSEIWWINTPHWNHIESFIKKVENDKIPKMTTTEKEQILNVLSKWREVVALIKEAEPLIISGRKIQKRITPARTLENTGTCAICGKNCKLDGGKKIVNHGFTVEYHQQNGSCFGVGYSPWELSPEGATALVERCLMPEKHRLEESLKILVWSPKTFERIRSALRGTLQELSYCQSRIDSWERSSLPGDPF